MSLMLNQRSVKFVIFFLFTSIGTIHHILADNPKPSNEAERILNLTHLYQIETIDSLLQAVFEESTTDQDLNPLQTNFLLFQIGRKSLAIQNLQSQYNQLINNALPQERARFLELYSVLLEEMGQSEKALSLWKDMAKMNEGLGNDNIPPVFSLKSSGYTTIKNLMIRLLCLKLPFKTHHRKIVRLMYFLMLKSKK